MIGGFGVGYAHDPLYVLFEFLLVVLIVALVVAAVQGRR